MRKQFELLSELMGTEAGLIEISAEQMKERDLKYARDFPLCFGSSFKLVFENARFKEDFSFQRTDFKQSLKNTIAWNASRNWPLPQAGLDPDKEVQILDKFSQLSD